MLSSWNRVVLLLRHDVFSCLICMTLQWDDFLNPRADLINICSRLNACVRRMAFGEWCTNLTKLWLRKTVTESLVKLSNNFFPKRCVFSIFSIGEKFDEINPGCNLKLDWLKIMLLKKRSLFFKSLILTAFREKHFAWTYLWSKRLKQKKL